MKGEKERRKSELLFFLSEERLSGKRGSLLECPDFCLFVFLRPDRFNREALWPGGLHL